MDEMAIPQSDFDRLLFFEAARKTAENTYAVNPEDADNLTRWGGALLELSQFQQGSDCVKMVKDAVSKLEEALKVSPNKHDTLWCLGNAHTSHAFLIPEHEVAKIYFRMASQYFQQAVEQDPTNELYQKSLELTEKAPELHLEVHKQIFNPESVAAGSSTVSNLKRYLQQHDEVELSALGMAIATVVTVAEILKNNGLAIEKRILTSTVEMKDETRERPIQKAKVEIILTKADKFDELMAAASEERELGGDEDGHH